MSETNGYLSPVIEDGYNRVSVIPEREGRWNAVRLRWRKLSADEISAINARASLDLLGGYCQHYAKVMAEKILDWDVKMANGSKAPITAETIQRMDFDFYTDLRNVVSGERPEWEEGGPQGDEKNS
jgi:hypothetical protein